MRIDCIALETGYPFFKVYYTSGNSYKVDAVKAYLEPDNQWRIVFHVAFSSLVKLHKWVNENHFSVYCRDKECVDRLFCELSETGKVHLNAYDTLSPKALSVEMQDV